MINQPLPLYTFIGTHEQMNIILAALGDIAHKHAGPITAAMVSQFQKQENDAAQAEQERVEFEASRPVADIAA
jgi:hypothetical protein